MFFKKRPLFIKHLGCRARKPDATQNVVAICGLSVLFVVGFLLSIVTYADYNLGCVAIGVGILCQLIAVLGLIRVARTFNRGSRRH